MHTLKIFAPSLALLAVMCLPLSSQADDNTHRQAVESLFELTQMQKKIEESVENVLRLQLAQNPDMHEHAAKVKEFLERHIGWQSMKDALTGMYMDEFTEQEVNDMNFFYSSTTGRKVIERLPALVSMRNQLASERLQNNIGELQYAIQGSSKQ